MAHGEDISVKWIADDPKHYLHGSIERISAASILEVNGVDVAGFAGSGSALTVQVGDLLKVSTWPLWSAVVMPFDADEPRAKRPRMMEKSPRTVISEVSGAGTRSGIPPTPGSVKDPINYGEELIDINKRISNIETVMNEVLQKKISNIENVLNEVLQKTTDKKPELEPKLPGPSPTLNASYSITDEDLESIFSDLCASPPFQSAKLVNPSIPGPSSLSNPPFFPVELAQPITRPRSLSVPPLLDRTSARLMSPPPPPFVPTIPLNALPPIPPSQMSTIPSSSMLPVPPIPPMVMPSVELPHRSDDRQSVSTSTFKPEQVHQVLLECERFLTGKDIGRVAIALAKRCFFGEAALAAATLYGKGGTKQKLARQKLLDLRKALEQTPPFQNKTSTELEHLWKQCQKAIANACKELRKKENAKAEAENKLEEAH